MGLEKKRSGLIFSEVGKARMMLLDKHIAKAAAPQHWPAWFLCWEDGHREKPLCKEGKVNIAVNGKAMCD